MGFKQYKILLLLITLISCNLESNEEYKIEQKVLQNESNDSLVIHKLKEEAKWRMYCLYIDDTVASNFQDKNYDSKLSRSFSEMELFLNGSVSVNDTAIISYCFKNNANDNCEMYKKSSPILLVSSIVFSKKTGSVLYYEIGDGAILYSKDSASRFLVPLQPEVLHYIKINYKRFHPWLQREINNRGILLDK